MSDILVYDSRQADTEIDKMENPKFTGIRLPQEHMTKLDAIATQKRVSRNVVILWALDDYLARFSLPACPPQKTSDEEESQHVNA